MISSKAGDNSSIVHRRMKIVSERSRRYNTTVVSPFHGDILQGYLTKTKTKLVESTEKKILGKLKKSPVSMSSGLRNLSSSYREVLD